MARTSWRRLIKAILPKRLLGRSLLISVSPLVLVQIGSAYVFFATHWAVVTRRLATGLAGDIGAVIDMMQAFPGRDNRFIIFDLARHSMDLIITLDEGKTLDRTGMVGAAPRGWIGFVEAASIRWLEKKDAPRESIVRICLDVFFATLATAVTK